jgi:hypothetical protein
MATPALAFAQIANEIEAEGLTPQHAQRVADQLATTFSLQKDEVALMVLDKTLLHFAYPSKLSNVGSIPVNTSSSVAARTASTRRAEVINNFAQTKHASVFESVDLMAHKTMNAAEVKKEKQEHIIQKLMSVPVMGPAGAIGVIQVCRKGISAPAAGADFTPADLQRLVAIAGSLAKAFKLP